MRVSSLVILRKWKIYFWGIKKGKFLIKSYLANNQAKQGQPKCDSRKCQ